MVFRRTRSPYLPQRPFRLHSTMQNPAIVVKNHRFLPPIRSVATEKVVSYLSHTLRSRVVTQNEARPGVTWNLRIVICEFHVVPGLFCFRATSGNRSLTLHAAEGPRGRRGPSTAKGQAYRNFCGALDWFSLSVGGVGVSRGGVEFVPVDAGPVCGRDAVVRFGRRCLFALPQGVGDE